MLRSLVMVLTIAGILLGCYMAVRPQETKVIPQEFMSPARITVHLNEQNEPVNVYSDEIPLSNGWQCCTQDLCRRYGIDYPLMLGLMETESSFQLDADSGWAYGVCQIGYINEEWLADKHIDIYSPLGNIEAACLILSGYLENYTTEQALMAYNCGEFGAQELWDEGIYQSDYSRSVLESAQKWRSVLNDRS